MVAARFGAPLASRARACCYILGSLSQLQDSVAVTIRIYRRGGEEAWQTLAVTGSPNDLADLVRRMLVEVIRRLSLGTSPLTPAQFERGLTRSPDALKAWLSAREHQRRGRGRPNLGLANADSKLRQRAHEAG